jgi:hypothetical protein
VGNFEKEWAEQERLENRKIQQAYNTAKGIFDPWDWLGVHCGGYFDSLDWEIVTLLTYLRDGDLQILFECEPPTRIEYRQLICTLLCNTDAFEFEFEGDPTNLRFVGDDRFKTLQELIDAWSAWAKERYS